MRPTVVATVFAAALALPVSTFAAGGGADPQKIEAVKPSKPADPAFAPLRQGQTARPEHGPSLSQPVDP